MNPAGMSSNPLEKNKCCKSIKRKYKFYLAADFFRAGISLYRLHSERGNIFERPPRSFVFQCEPIPNQGFKRGSYRCTCKRGYYYPDVNANIKAFNGSAIEEEYDKKQKGLSTNYDDQFDCVPCSEGCEECTDGGNCVYHVNLLPRVILISVDGLVALMAVALGAVVFMLRESKVCVKRVIILFSGARFSKRSITFRARKTFFTYTWFITINSISNISNNILRKHALG